MLNTVHAQIKPARLIIRGDDMGFSHAGIWALLNVLKTALKRPLK